MVAFSESQNIQGVPASVNLHEVEQCNLYDWTCAFSQQTQHSVKSSEFQADFYIRARNNGLTGQGNRV